MRIGFNPEHCNIKTDVPGIIVDEAFLAHFQVAAANAVAASNAGIHVAVTDTGAQQIITTNITQPSVPRNITATAGGTSTDIKALQVVVEGTDYAGNIITETLPAFTIDTPGTVQGNKAFKTVTKITIPAHDGTGATTAVGFGEKIGLPYTLAHNTICDAYLDNAKEGTAPTVTVDASTISRNTLKLNSALNSKVVDAYLIV